MDLPSNWDQCEREHFQHFDPYDDDGFQNCDNCDETTEVDEIFETPTKKNMCRTCIDNGEADIPCTYCEGSGEGFMIETSCTFCGGKGVTKFHVGKNQ